MLQQIQNRNLPRGWDILAVIALTLIITVLVAFGTRSTIDDAPEFDHSKIGVHLLLDDGRNTWDPSLWSAHLDFAAQAVGERGFVVQVVTQDNMDVDHWQQFMDLAGEHNLTPILRLATTFDTEAGVWTAPNSNHEMLASEWADFLNGLDWHGDQKYIIVLNEPNNGHEWGGTPDPVAYANLLATFADTFHADVEGALVLNGALDLYAPDTGSTPLDEDDGISFISAPRFMDEMVAAVPDIFERIDVWNSHSYPVGFSEPPRTQSLHFDAVNDAEEIEFEDLPELTYNRGINGYEWELWKLEEYGLDPMPLVMITETGWRHSAGRSDSADAGDDYPTPQLAATFLENALSGHPSGNYDPLLADDRILGVIVFALNGIPSEWSHTNLLIMTDDGEVLGTYPTFDVLTAYHDSAEDEE